MMLMLHELVCSHLPIHSNGLTKDIESKEKACNTDHGTHMDLWSKLSLEFAMNKGEKKMSPKSLMVLYRLTDGSKAEETRPRNLPSKFQR